MPKIDVSKIIIKQPGWFARKFPWVLLFLVLLSVIAFQWFITANKPQTRQISVVGECIGNVEKDKTAISLRVRTLAPTGAESMAAARAAYVKVSTMLNDFEGLEIQTASLSSYEKTEWNNDQNRSISLGIQTEIVVDVSSSNTADIEAILAKAEKIENVFPENLRMFTSKEKMKPALEACIGDATQNARAKAELIAQSDGIKVGKMLSANYSQTVGDEPSPRPLYMMREMMAAPAADSGISLQSTDTEISVSVSTVFELK